MLLKDSLSDNRMEISANMLSYKPIYTVLLARLYGISSFEINAKPIFTTFITHIIVFIIVYIPSGKQNAN